MTFAVWTTEFCVMHVKLQTIYEILEANRLADFIIIIKTLTIPRRFREIHEWVRFRNKNDSELGYLEYFPWECNYDEHGERHGITRGWYKNGQIWYESNYEHGTLHGISRQWCENGQLMHECNYDEHGEKHGISREWHPDGEIKYKNNYEHGRLINF